MKFSRSGPCLLLAARPSCPNSGDPRTLGIALPASPALSRALPLPLPGLTGFFQILPVAPTSLQYLACQPRSALCPVQGTPPRGSRRAGGRRRCRRNKTVFSSNLQQMFSHN